MIKTLCMRSAVAIALLLASSEAIACSCGNYPTPAEALKASGLVFLGHVTAATTVELPRLLYTKTSDGQYTPFQHMERRSVVTLKVLEEWKGSHAKTYTILAGPLPETPLPPGYVIVDCQTHLEVGKTYLIFATEGYPEADPCAPTSALDRAGGTIKELNRLRRKPNLIK